MGLRDGVFLGQHVEGHPECCSKPSPYEEPHCPGSALVAGMMHVAPRGGFWPLLALTGGPPPRHYDIRRNDDIINFFKMLKKIKK